MKSLTGDLGQPYALRQAGLGAGVFLLVGLTIVVRGPPAPSQITGAGKLTGMLACRSTGR